MKTIPDAIDDMKQLIKKIIDKPLSWMESIGSKIICCKAMGQNKNPMGQMG